MKRLLVIASLLICTFAVNAQSEKFITAMKENIAAMVKKANSFFMIYFC